MSTYYGGPELQSKTAIDHQNNTGNADAYTCPSGKYAEVLINGIVITGGSATVTITGTNGSTVVHTISASTGPFSLRLDAGAKIKSAVPGGAVNLSGVALEYAHP